MLDLKLKKTLVFRKAGVFYFLILIVTDQTVKYLAHNIFRNSNFAFSLPLPAWLMFAVYFIVILAMLIYVIQNYRHFGTGQALAWLLIFAGALSNVGERIYFGYVRDFIYIYFYRWVGVYNLADGYIILGILILVMQNVNIKNDIMSSRMK
jgi:lipoprotein signal peptidase